jgi:hypothetical protein
VYREVAQALMDVGNWNYASQLFFAIISLLLEQDTIDMSMLHYLGHVFSHSAGVRKSHFCSSNDKFRQPMLRLIKDILMFDGR